MANPLNGKLLPMALTALLASVAAFGAAQYFQGSIAARVSATEIGLQSLGPVIRSIDRRLARLEGYARASRQAEP